jgi:hypothetical protein
MEDGGELDAWHDWCRRLAALGELITTDRFPTAAQERAEGFRYLARVTALALLRASDFDDPEFPMIGRENDDVTKWAGPNVDNIYLRAPVSARHVYRLTADVSASPGFIIQTLAGWWGDDDFRIGADRSSEQLVIEPDGRVEIVLGGAERPGNWMPLDDDCNHVMIREYFIDWDTDGRCDFLIERIDDGPSAPELLTAARVGRSLDRAATWLEANVPFWNDFVANMVASLPPNSLGAPFQTPLGGADIYYGNGRVELDDDHVLLIETAVPDARYWSIQLYSHGWYESLDFANRQTSLNNTQAHIDADGRVRVVIARHDPGVPNWLDLAGHERAFMHSRAVWCRQAPVPTSRVVRGDELRQLLPPDHPTVGPDERRARLVARRAQVLRRHRR